MSVSTNFTKNGAIAYGSGSAGEFSWSNPSGGVDLYILQNVHVSFASAVSADVDIKISGSDSVSRVIGNITGSGIDFYFDSIYHPVANGEYVIISTPTTGVGFNARMFLTEN